MKTKLIFCAVEQKETDHVLTVDNNGEINATCECGRFIKFPASKTATEVETLIIEQKESNLLTEDQAKVEEARKEAEIVIDELAGITATSTVEDSPEK